MRSNLSILFYFYIQDEKMFDPWFYYAMVPVISSPPVEMQKTVNVFYVVQTQSDVVIRFRYTTPQATMTVSGKSFRVFCHDFSGPTLRVYKRNNLGDFCNAEKTTIYTAPPATL